MKTILVDSDVLIEVLRNRNPAIVSRWETLGETLILYSPVTAAEIWQGAREPEAPALRALFSAMTCVPIDAEIGARAGACLKRYRASHGIELGDALIAATAVVHGVPLWTRNRKHYPMPELRLV